MKYILAVFCLSIAASGAVAAPRGDKASYTSYGVGIVQCSEWSARRPDKDYYTMGQWMLGYVSAAAYQQNLSLRTDAKELAGWMDVYCNANPQVKFADATREMLRVVFKSNVAK